MSLPTAERLAGINKQFSTLGADIGDLLIAFQGLETKLAVAMEIVDGQQRVIVANLGDYCGCEQLWSCPSCRAKALLSKK